MDGLQQADLLGFVRKYGSVEQAKRRALKLAGMMLKSGQRHEAREWIAVYFRLVAFEPEYA